MAPKVAAVLEALRGHLEAVYGDRLVRCVLFGSQARSHFLSALCLEHETLVSCLYMDQDRFLHRQGPLLRNIRREGVAV